MNAILALLSPAAWRLVGLAAIVAAAFVGGWTFNGWRLGTQLANKDKAAAELRAKLAEATERERATVSDHRQALESRNEQEALRARSALRSFSQDASDLRAASLQLRRHFASAPSAPGAAGPGASTAPVGGAPSAGPELVPAVLWIGAEDEAIELGPALDAARERGLTCERAYDAARDESLKLRDQLSRLRAPAP